MIQWLDAALNKPLSSASLHALWFKCNCMIIIGITFINSSVVAEKVPGSSTGVVIECYVN